VFAVCFFGYSSSILSYSSSILSYSSSILNFTFLGKNFQMPVWLTQSSESTPGRRRLYSYYEGSILAVTYTNVVAPHWSVYYVIKSDNGERTAMIVWSDSHAPAGELHTRHGVLTLFSLETYNLYSITSQLKRLFDPVTISISPPVLGGLTRDGYVSFVAFI